MPDQKTPEQIAAEQKLEAQVKEAQDKAAAEKVAADKAAADKKAAQLEARKKKAGEAHFVREGKVYKPILHAVHIPGLGQRSALEICADEEAQAYLINEGCIGSVIVEVR